MGKARDLWFSVPRGWKTVTRTDWTTPAWYRDNDSGGKSQHKY